MAGRNRGINSRQIVTWTEHEDGSFWITMQGDVTVRIESEDSIKTFQNFIDQCNYVDAHGNYIHT